MEDENAGFRSGLCLTMLFDWPITVAALAIITIIAMALGYWAIRQMRD
jgi:hypothetical protein